MYFTGFTRFSSEIQRANHITSGEKHLQLKEMLALVDEAEKVLTAKTAFRLYMEIKASDRNEGFYR